MAMHALLAVLEGCTGQVLQGGLMDGPSHAFRTTIALQGGNGRRGEAYQRISFEMPLQKTQPCGNCQRRPQVPLFSVCTICTRYRADG